MSRTPVIHFKNLSARLPLPASFPATAVRVLKKIIQAEMNDACEVTVILTDDSRIRTLNRTYRRVNAATDVLAFGFYADELTATHYGDIYISLDRVRAQTRQYQVPFWEELSRLIIHGALTSRFLGTV